MSLLIRLDSEVVNLAHVRRVYRKCNRDGEPRTAYVYFFYGEDVNDCVWVADPQGSLWDAICSVCDVKFVQGECR